MSQPTHGTIAETYLRNRDITGLRNCGALRFHPRCWHRGDEDDPPDTPDAWPALVASARDGDGKLTGVSRTSLDPSGMSKAPVSTPRRAMGHQLGHGVHFGVADDVIAAGEGIETMLSLRQVAPTLPMVAGLSANHLAALLLPDGLRRLYLVRDDDPAERMAMDTLATRAAQAGVGTQVLDAACGDLDEDLRRLGRGALAAARRVQLAPEDVARFMALGSIGREAG